MYVFDRTDTSWDPARCLLVSMLTATFKSSSSMPEAPTTRRCRVTDSGEPGHLHQYEVLGVLVSIPRLGRGPCWLHLRSRKIAFQSIGDTFIQRVCKSDLSRAVAVETG